MILEQLKVLDIQRVGDLNDGIQAGITEESLPFIFELVSKQLYSNPIGSVIREIVSNCFDSHIEAGVSDPVIVSKTYHSEEGYSIEFKDVGVGLSPERVSTIYMNYFSSTKRHTNTLIGSFGIGSKTPLAYADLFYITTIYDSIKYEYIFHKGENKPTLELLNQELTTERNGTTIKINIDYDRNKYYSSMSGGNDLDKFTRELRFQLAYFDDVYFKDWSISNDYDIYEGKYFKFRSDIDQYNTQIHLCIGKVRYAIDFTKVDINKHFHKLPIAVKFEIGELKITPSREALRYDEEGIKKIKERIDLATNEIIDIFNKQNPEIEDLEVFDKLVKSNKPKITFDVDKKHDLYLWSNSGVSKNYRFKPLSGINIKKNPTHLFFMWEIVGQIRDGIYIPSKWNQEVGNDLIISKRYLILGKEDRISVYTGKYIEERIGNTTIIKRKSIKFESACKELGLNTGNELGKSRAIIQYMKVMNGIVRERGGLYSDFRPTDEWINEYKRSIIESSAAWKRKNEQKIFVRDALDSFRGSEIKVVDLQKRTGILVYGFKEDKNLLNHIWNTVYTCCTTKGIQREKAFKVIQISRSVENSVTGGLTGPEKTIYCRDFLRTKFIRKMETAKYIEKSFKLIEYNLKDFKRQFIRDFQEYYVSVVSSYQQYCKGSGNYYLDYEDDMTKNYIPEMLIPLEKFKSKFTNVQIPALIPYLTIPSRESIEARKEYIDYLKSKRVKLRTKHYLREYPDYFDRIAHYKLLNEEELLLIINQIENVN